MGTYLELCVVTYLKSRLSVFCPGGLGRPNCFPHAGSWEAPWRLSQGGISQRCPPTSVRLITVLGLQRTHRACMDASAQGIAMENVPQPLSGSVIGFDLLFFSICLLPPVL